MDLEDEKQNTSPVSFQADGLCGTSGEVFTCFYGRLVPPVPLGVLEGLVVPVPPVPVPVPGTVLSVAPPGAVWPDVVPDVPEAPVVPVSDEPTPSVVDVLLPFVPLVSPIPLFAALSQPEANANKDRAQRIQSNLMTHNP
ncbi:MAG: hypothetical protein AB7O38_13435 [Pirellulaceae bacterium]